MLKKKESFIPKISTVQFITIMFIVIIFLGAFLLWLPFTQREGQSISFINALFVATSSVCVTGLTPVNISEVFNPIGHTIMLLLIELGGLGFMSVVLTIAILLKKRLSFQSRLIMKDMLNADSHGGIVRLLQFVLRFSLIVQTAGAILLSIQFVPEYGLAKGIYFSIFHAVSAFCNAGFDLFGNSLIGYQSNPYVLMVISLLIIAGGFGFIVWYDLIFYKKSHKLSLHTRLAFIVTGILLVTGTLIFYFTDSLKTGSWVVRLVNSFFLSVTPRTAGFVSIDYADFSYAGILLTIVLMFIGGTSGSTAGGVKTTTIGVLGLQVISLFKGREAAEGFERTVPMAIVLKSFVLVFFASMLCFVSALILSLTENVPQNSGIEYVLFEVVSAFATVGLTMGLTPDLTTFGKGLIIMLMFIGRVGLYTVSFSLIRQSSKANKNNITYPKETVLVG
ncbi:Trk family potassium uptake protein [Vagococcus penaei]|uniref:Trk family potassium uptake protein n=1 Tax=Vagococcus penaei TaxID=633807 RepID=A0A1Q2D7J6_9ENTE|nr:TrkH family potassium uptake protein [Vagococcus penaei]AQP54396.1 Trk family potassium uptake protein [Vagococcus penaei]RSU06312.1 Trk family potassium uptake protein [Vagococcus penaei]